MVIIEKNSQKRALRLADQCLSEEVVGAPRFVTLMVIFAIIIAASVAATKFLS